jgi:hypothetical protein
LSLRLSRQAIASSSTRIASATGTTGRAAAEMLDVFGMQQGGSQYRRLIAAFQRVTVAITRRFVTAFRGLKRSGRATRMSMLL